MHLSSGLCLALETASAAASHALSQSDTSLEICPWNPSTQLLSNAIDDSGLDSSSSTIWSNNRLCPPENRGWNWGEPHICVKDFCVYSNPLFANGRGIVIISRSRNADALSRIPLFAQGSLSGINGTLAAPFHITEIPGKGLGIVASRLIRRGQQIMSHTPSVIVHRQLIEELSDEETFHIFDGAVSQLPDVLRKAFLNQMGHFGGHKINDILNTNSFELRLPIGDGHHFANFPEVSRFNHDCRPNVVYYIDNSLRHQTHAVRDIQPGEELTISYVDALSVRNVRQDRAQRSWGFKCSCAHCSMPAADVNASDYRLFRMYEIEQRLANYSVQVDEAQLELLFHYYREENLLESHGGDVYTLAALFYNSMGSEELAIKYAELSIEQGMLENGQGGLDVKAMRLFLEDPRGHSSWGRRLKKFPAKY